MRASHSFDKLTLNNVLEASCCVVAFPKAVKLYTFKKRRVHQGLIRERI